MREICVKSPVNYSLLSEEIERLRELGEMRGKGGEGGLLLFFLGFCPNFLVFVQICWFLLILQVLASLLVLAFWWFWPFGFRVALVIVAFDRKFVLR